VISSQTPEKDEIPEITQIDQLEIYYPKYASVPLKMSYSRLIAAIA